MLALKDLLCATEASLAQQTQENDRVKENLERLLLNQELASQKRRVSQVSSNRTFIFLGGASGFEPQGGHA